MLLIQPVMDIIANLSWIAVRMVLRLCLCSEFVWTKERRKTKRIVSWLVHGATAHIFLLLNHPPLFFRHSGWVWFILRWFLLHLHVYTLAFEVPLCNRVVFPSGNNKGYHIKWLVVFFLLQPSFESKAAAAATWTKPILWQHTIACVCVAFSDPTERNFFMLLWVFVSLQY